MNMTIQTSHRTSSSPLPVTALLTLTLFAAGTAAGATASAGALPEANAAAGATRAAVGPITFFKSQEPVCRAFAKKHGNPAVPSSRFRNAHLVHKTGPDRFLIADGAGTKLVVRPKKAVVLPGSGSSHDLMPHPYNFGCPAEVFRGTLDH